MPTMPKPAGVLTGTIFDDDLARLTDDPIRHQRACGLFYLHGVNPGATASGGCVTKVSGDADFEGRPEDQVEVHYAAIYLPPGISQWDTSSTLRDDMPVPAGVICEHDGAANPHKVKQNRSFIATWQEVAR